jgi:uncharacterized surface protein with fasciclin (FAS1) repeats
MRPALLALLLSVASGCGSDEKSPATPAPAAPAAAEATDTVLGVAATSADLSTFVSLAEASGLDATLGDTAQTFTVFAPSNAAFAALGADGVAALRADPAALRARLAGHVLAYRSFTTDVDVETTVSTLSGAEVTLVPGDPLGVRGGGVSARVATPDLDAGNGVVHVVDAVLAP